MPQYTHESYRDEGKDSTPRPTTYEQSRQNDKIYDAIEIAIRNVDEARDLLAKRVEQREHEYKREMDEIDQNYRHDMEVLKEERNRLNQLKDALSLLKVQRPGLFVRDGYKG